MYNNYRRSSKVNKQGEGVNDWEEQLQSSLKSQSRTLNVHYWLLPGVTIPERRRTEKAMLLLLCWSSAMRGQAGGVGMLLADQQAGIPSGMLVTDQSEVGKSVGSQGCWEGMGKRGDSRSNPSSLQETTEGEWLWLIMWLSGEEFGLLLDDEGLPLFLICSHVSPSALAKWSSTEPVMDTELVAVGSGSL